MDTIKVKDFNNELYIAMNGVPLLPVGNDWTAQQILDKLADLRDGYMKFRITKNEQPYITMKDYVDRDQSENQ